MGCGGFQGVRPPLFGPLAPSYSSCCYSVEQIVAKLREAERLQAQGQTVAQVCRRLGISDQTFFRWRTKYGTLKEGEAQRLKALEAENARLKKIVAEQALDISALKDLQRGKW